MTIKLNMLSGTVEADLAKLVGEMKDETLAFLLEKAVNMVQVAQSLCPVDTGSLRDSIRVEQHPDKIVVKAGGLVVNPKTGRVVDYATIVENTQPFMMPAWGFIEQGIVEELRSRVEQRVST